MIPRVVSVEEMRDGSLWMVSLNRPKANILDGEMIRALTGLFERARDARSLKAICLTSVGDHFSFGASVEEHRPDQVREMLGTFHELFRSIADADVTVLAAVRGQCLGGGLELVTFCHRVFAANDAKLGQPEIRLGVFAPIASLILPDRVGRSAAEDLCLTGRVLPAPQAHAIGLVDELAEDPVAAAVDYFEKSLAVHSAASLRLAARALRSDFNLRFFGGLEEMERLYLDDLMATHDAREGIEAFIEKRAPEWRNE